MLRRASLAAALLLTTLAAPAQVPTPEQFFGFKMGTDQKLARWDKIVEYMQKVAATSGRVRVRNLGTTTLGNPFIVVEVASEDTMKNLDHYKALEKKLYFQGGAPTTAEVDEIKKSGKSVVLITSNIHSTEIGSSQHAVDLVYMLATGSSAKIQKILDNDILLLVPSLNPDGQIMVTDWYNKYLGTQYEANNLPYLYHFYVGHDDNRDEYMFTQKESRMTAEILWHDWYPSIWLDEHQQGSEGSRMFTMPATDPINPNVDPLIYRLTTIYGQQQAASLEEAGKTGISYNSTYTNFWPGAMAWTGWWHNQVGLLTEAASARIASPMYQKKSDPLKPGGTSESSSGGRSTEAPAGGGYGFGPRASGTEQDPLPPPRDISPRMDYSQPWLGGKWTLGDIVDYENIDTIALLEAAADRRSTLVDEIYSINKRTIDLGAKGSLAESKDKFYAAIIPVASQHDPDESIELIDKLMIGGVDIYKATAAFTQDGTTYPAGTFVAPFNQVFGRYAKDMLEKQYYPEVRRAPNAPAEAPYDVAAWSLGMQLGVSTPFAKTPLPADIQLEKVAATPALTLAAEKTKTGYTFPYLGASDAVVINRLLKDGAKVSFAKAHGSEATYVVTTASPDAWKSATKGFTVTSATTPALDTPTNLNKPRIGLYQSWTANMDEGWTRWVFDHYEVPFTTLHNPDIKAGHLREKYDAIVLPDARSRDIIDGRSGRTVTPEYTGGIGETGFDALKEFVAQGGTLIAMGDACDLLIDRLPLPVKDIKATLTNAQHFAPGTIVNLQVDTAHPVGWGVAPATYGFYINSPFFEVTDGFSSQKVDIVARYPNTDAMASGWLRGEQYQLGKAAVVAIDMNPGKVVLFGIRPQHRAQTHATFPLLFNALYWSSEGMKSEGAK